MNWSENKLTEEIKANLKQGTKVKFKWYGNADLEYIGRIEVDERFGVLYFVNESFYEGEKLTQENMRFYNRLSSFEHFTMFEII